MPTNAIKHCENEPRIIKLENRLDYKEEKIEQLIADNKEIRSDINKLTIAVTELSNTLKIREEDSQKLDKVENDLIDLKATVRTVKYILPLIYTFITIKKIFIF